MAASYERASARIRVQVVATLLPFNLPVHVNSFWTLIQFSETRTICNVEDKILNDLNSMAKKCQIEIVVLDRPVNSSWTYVPVAVAPTSTTKDTNNINQQNTFFNSGSVNSTSAQELAILLKPYVCEYGNKKMIKPVRPVLMKYDVSSDSSVRLIFKKQLILMQDCALLNDSRSEILRDNDVIVINTVCTFFTVDTVDNLKSQDHATDSFESEDQISRDSLKDLNKNCLLFDSDEESNPGIEIELSPEIRIKFDKIVQKLASLKSSHIFDNRCVLHKKSKKRKVCQENYEDNETESSSINMDVNKNDHQEQKHKKKSTGEQLTYDHNEISMTNEIAVDTLVSKNKKKSKKEKKRSKIEFDAPLLMDTSSVYATDEVIQIVQTGPHNENEKNEARDCPSLDMEVPAQSLKTGSRSRKRKPADFEVNLICALSNQQAVKVNEDNHKAESIHKVTERKVKESTTENMAVNVPVSIKRSEQKRYKIEVDDVDLAESSFTHAIDGIVHESQNGPHLNGKEGDKVHVYLPVDMDVPVQSLNTNNNHRKRKPAGFGLSSLISALRNQQAVEVNEDNHKEELINIETEKQVEDNRIENTDSDISFIVKQQDSLHTTPKRKRVRKRKNKKSNVLTCTSSSVITECKERDYTLKLSEHHMPQNSRVTFECDSDDNAAQVTEAACRSQSTSLHEHFDIQNSATENDYPPGNMNHTSVVDITTKSDIAKVPFNTAGAAIDPDEKFQALLNQCGRIGRQFETISSKGGHAVIRGLRQKRNTSDKVNAADPDRDVLTNVSIITEALGVETSESKASDHIANPSTSGNSNDKTPSQPDHKKFPTNHLNTAQENKCILPEVIVCPLSKNYSSCQELHDLPMEGDIIAYKILELSDDYTPGLSSFKEAKVINVNTKSGTLLLESRERKDNKARAGRFEMILDVTDNANNEEDANLMEVSVTELVDTKLVYRSVNKE